MLKKLFYVGLGISIIVAKKSVSYFLARRSESEGSEGEKSMAAQESPDRSRDDILAQATADIEAATDDTPVAASTSEHDDLTMITGIGPTYAKRLKAAGIGTFSALSQQSPERIHEVAQLRGQTSEAASWISQAAVLAV